MFSRLRDGKKNRLNLLSAVMCAMIKSTSTEIAIERFGAVFTNIAKIANAERKRRSRKVGRVQRKQRSFHRPVNKRQDHVVGNYKIYRSYFALRGSSPETFYEKTRMSIVQFDQLVSLVIPNLHGCMDLFNDLLLIRLKTSAKVALTLRYLATGDSIPSIATEIGIEEKFVHKIINETCSAIRDALMPLFLKKPTLESLKIMADSFWTKYQLPNCLGSIQDRVFRIKAPIDSDFEDYSLFILASSDANYCFAFATLGIIKLGVDDDESDDDDDDDDDSCFDLNIDDTSVPPPSPLPGTDVEFPYFFISHEGSELKRNVMTPIGSEHLKGRTEKSLSNKLYNQRLSRVMSATENAFGILAANWRLFHNKIQVDGKTAKRYVQAIICLHNYILKTNADIGYSAGPGRDGDEVVNGKVVVPGKWRTEQEGSLWEPTEAESSAKFSEEAGKIRDGLVQFLAVDVFASHNLRAPF